MKIYIYQIWFPTSKKSYIGQTCNLEKRIESHFKSGYLVCKALWKYDNWQISILHTVKTRDEANRIEIEEIRNFNCVVPNGYNLTRGGEGSGGLKWTKEQKQKLAQVMLGGKRSEETKIKMSLARKKQIPPFQNKKHSVKTKEKMRKVKLDRKRKPFSEEHKVKISKANLGRKNSKESILKQKITKLKNKIIREEIL